jgi:hypothetical protein
MIMEFSAHQPELVHLNLADLDVEELEQRMELASAAPAADCWVNCGTNIG